MTVATFDPEAREEFLSTIQYYEDCRVGLGLRFRHIIEAAIKKIIETPFRYRVSHAPFRRYLLPKFPCFIRERFRKARRSFYEFPLQFRAGAGYCTNRIGWPLW